MCCAPRFGGASRRCSADGVRCANCCKPRLGIAAAPCDVNSPDINEGVETHATDPARPAQFLLRDGSAVIVNSTLGDGLAAAPPPADLAMMQGGDGQYAFVVPSLNVTVVTLGMSRPDSARCAGAYDDAWGAGVVWSIVAPGVAPARGAGTPAAPPPPTEAAAHAPPPGSVDSGAAPLWVGSCQCDCPKGAGFGWCFNVGAASAPAPPGGVDACARIPPQSPVGVLLSSAAAFCPRLVRNVECDPTDGWDPCLHASNHTSAKCVALRGCTAVPTAGTHIAGCECPVHGRFSPCVWRPPPCEENPYYPTYRPA